MVESLVQYTLLNNTNYLAEVLDFDVHKVIGKEITTEWGRIDFVLSNNKNESLIVELETILDSKSKLDYCFNQTLNYKNVKFNENTNYCILFAEETKNHKAIEEFGKSNEIIIQSYSLEYTKKLYADTINRLSLNVGLALPSPKNYTICYLRWLNKIMKTFSNLNREVLNKDEILKPFTSSKGRATNFNCYERIGLDFELFEKSSKNYILTEYGKTFINNINPFINTVKNASSIELTNEQKRLLLKILTNGNWENKVHKVNIYWFLRFIEITNGNWLPKNYNIDTDKLEIARGLFNVSYKERTMYEFLNWCCNYCFELGLVEVINTNSKYNQVTLTPLGIEINNIFSIDLSLKKYRMNLSFKFLE